MTSCRWQKMLILTLLLATGCRALDRGTSRSSGHDLALRQPAAVATESFESNFVTASNITIDTPAKAMVGSAASHKSLSKNIQSQTELATSTSAKIQNDGISKKVCTVAFSAEQPVPLSLDAAIVLALEQNPDLIAIRAGEPVAAAGVRVSKSYPYNPQFQTQIAPYSRDRNGEDGSVSQQHVLVQTYELGGQQQHRERMASANWRQVNGTIHQAELANTAQTTRLYLAAVYQRELRDLSQSVAEMNEQLVGVIERREKAGQANITEVKSARLQANASRRQFGLAEASFQTAMVSLRNHLNFDPHLTLDLTGHWMDWEWRPLGSLFSLNQDPAGPESTILETADSVDSLDDEMLHQLVGNRPDIAAARSAVTMARENLRLANAMRRPSLQAGPMYQRDEASTSFWGLQAQFDIPVVNTGKPLVDQRCAELRQRQVTATQLENRARLEARAAIQRYAWARKLVEDSRAEFENDLAESLRPFEDQYQAGQITLLQVFVARTTLVQSKQSFLDLLNELSLATADVTWAIGLPPQDLISIAQP